MYKTGRPGHLVDVEWPLISIEFRFAPLDPFVFAHVFRVFARFELYGVLARYGALPATVFASFVPPGCTMTAFSPLSGS